MCMEENLEIRLLLDQRKELISDIKELNGNMFKIVAAAITLSIAVFVTYFPQVNMADAHIVRYAVLEIILILSMVICACLFVANIDRDYISAIDTYLFDKYNISVLFYCGELSKKHTTGITGIFPITTLLIGISAIVLIVFFIIYIYIQDKSFYQSHKWLIYVLGAQIIAYIPIICANFVRKVTKSSKVTTECLEYIKRSKEPAQQNEA